MDIYYIILVIPAVLLSLIASRMVTSRFNKYDKVKTKKNLTGAQAAQMLLNSYGINDVKVQHISGTLTDNYNPQTKILSLSDSTYASNSVAAVGVAAHETGHAIQHAKNYFPLNFRRKLVPIANLGSQLGPILAMAGLGMLTTTTADAASASSTFAKFAPLIINIGIGLFCGAVLFYLVTLPVEFNASHRALRILQKSETMDEEELAGAKKVLVAAALTYVGSALNAIGNLLRIILLSKKYRKSNY